MWSNNNVLKILNGYENIDINIGHGVTLTKKQCRLDIRTFSFSHRIVNEWNRLSADYSVVLIYLNIKSTYI